MNGKKIVACLLVGLSIEAGASDMRNATIQKMMVDTHHGDKLFIKATGSVDSLPSCSINGTWQYLLPLDTELKKDTMTSLLLSAYMAGKKVRLTGSGQCDSYNTIETLRRIEFEM